MPLKKNSLQKSIFILIVILAIITRIWGLTFSLPYIYHVDEDRFSKITIRYFTGDLNPHFFHVPSLYSYLVAGVWGAYFLLGKASGKFPTIAAFIESFNKNPTTFFILGRLLTVLLSIGTILLVYFIGKKMYNPRVGVIASLFLIFSPEHNKISHYLNPDSPMLVFLMLSFLFIWLIYQKGKTDFYILAGLFAGLGTATKYGGQLLFLPLFLAHMYYILDNKQPIKNIFLSFRLVLAGVFFLIGFFTGCPYAIFDFATFWRDFKWQSQHLLTLGHYGSSTAQPAWLFYLWYGFKENIGKFSQYLVLGGVIFGLVRHRKRELILFSFPLVLFLIMGSWKTRAVRYLLPLTPFFILIGSFFLDFILSKISSFFSQLGSKFKFLKSKEGIFTWALVFLFLLSPSLKVIKFDYILTQEDTRTIAKDWINYNIPKGVKIALESYCPPISRKNYRITYRHSLGEVDLEWVSRRKIKYVIISDIMYARFTRFPKEFPKQANNYNSLDEKAVLIKTFEPKWDEYLLDEHNPTIKIYKLSSCPNFSFPGNFAQYSQSAILTKSKGEEWILQSTINGQGLLEKDEKVKNPYLRIVDSKGKEVAKLIIHEGEIQTSDSFSYSNMLKFSSLPSESKISIGYEYYFQPNPLKFMLEGRLAKEYLLAEKIDPGSLLKNNLKYVFLYTAFPNTRGDDYFQIVTLSKTKATWTLFSTIFGGELRWGDDYVLNPIVKITDFEGKEITKLLFFKGKIGSIESEKRGPAKKSIVLPSLPNSFKIFVGYDYYFDKEYPNKAGGPELIEIKPLSFVED